MTPGTHARIWLLVPALLTAGCATSAHQEEKARVAPPTHSINTFAVNTVADAKEPAGEPERHRGPNPGGAVAGVCVRGAGELAMRTGGVGLLFALPFAAVCLPMAAAVGIVHEIAPQSAGVGTGVGYGSEAGLRKLTDAERATFPTTSAGGRVDYNREEPRGLSDAERSAFPTTAANAGSGFDRPELRKLGYGERSSFPANGAVSCWGFRC